MRRVLLLVVVCALAGIFAGVAEAHGERAQAGFIRLRGVTFFDVNFSTERIKVGEPLTITGKFRILDNWPSNISEPRVAFLTVAAPGPKVVVKDRQVNGVFTPGGIFIEKGKTYDFKVTVVGRTPGTWHVHPMVSVEKTGPLLGPGKWITVDPVPGGFKNPITLLNGQTVDLESFGMGHVAVWHIIWAVIGLAWVVYWVVRPIVQRAYFVELGAEDRLISGADRRISLALVGLTAAVLAIGYVYTRVNYPVTLPIQVYRFSPPERKESEHFVAARLKEAMYGPTTRTLVMTLEVQNAGTKPVHLTNFATAYLDFVNQQDARQGAQDLMVVEPGGSIRPGETREIKVTITNPAWQVERLLQIQEAQNAIAGLLFFRDADGRRDYVEVGAPVRMDYRVLTEVLS